MMHKRFGLITIELAQIIIIALEITVPQYSPIYRIKSS